MQERAPLGARGAFFNSFRYIFIQGNAYANGATPGNGAGNGGVGMNGNQGYGNGNGGNYGGSYSGSYTPGQIGDGNGGTFGQNTDLSGYLDQWRQAANEQAQRQIDYAVNKGVNDLQRAEEDAKVQFQTQRNQIDADEARGLDNAALYAELRGDRGGIGQLADGWNDSRRKRREEDRPLTEEEFDTYFERGYNETEDYEEWERYTQTLGKEAPGSFQEFQKIKYDDPDAYANLEGFYQYKYDVPEATREDFAAYNVLKELDLHGTVRVPPEAVSVKTLVFHDNHASHHGCTLDDAKSYVQNAFCTVRRTRWDGESINYYSAKGAAYIDAATGEIKTSFPRQKFDPLTKAIVEVFR